MAVSNGNQQVIAMSYLDSKDLEKRTEKAEEEVNVDTKRGKEERVYTVEDAIDYIGFGPFQILISVFSGMVWVSWQEYIQRMYM